MSDDTSESASNSTPSSSHSTPSPDQQPAQSSSGTWPHPDHRAGADQPTNQQSSAAQPAAEYQRADAQAAADHPGAAANQPAAAAQPAAASQQPAADQASAADQPAASSAAAYPAPTRQYPQFRQPTEATTPLPPYTAPTAATAQQPYAYAQTGSAQGEYAQPTGAGTTTATADRKRRPFVAPLIGALAVGALIGGASGAGVTAWAVNSNSGLHTTSSQSSPTTVTVNNPGSATAVTGAVATAGPSTVTVYVDGGQEAGSGSGVILSADGYILTNSHVVTLGGEASKVTIRVETADGRLFDGKVVGGDPVADLAVVKIEATGLTAAKFGDSGKLNVGDTTIALGAPLGLQNSASSGIVSALNRSITVASSEVPQSQPDQNNGNGSNPFNFRFDEPGQSQGAATSSVSLAVIQTDAAINHGNSGGPLVDDQGRVIGINVAIASSDDSSGSGDESGSIGVGFAIPSDVAQRVAQEIIKSGKASHGLLGASVQDEQSETGASNSDIVGAAVQKITSGGAADKAGLQAGDIVTSFNGIPITSSNDLTAQVRALAGGSTAKLVYVRGKQSTTADVTLGTYTS